MEGVREPLMLESNSNFYWSHCNTFQVSLFALRVVHNVVLANVSEEFISFAVSLKGCTFNFDA
jgi:hypothetical protein